jgi:uncharacterized protein YjbI with pentapeptide repeats
VIAKTTTGRTAWGIAAILAFVVLGGIALLLVRLRPYWVAKCAGVEADLHGAEIPFAPLRCANLAGASLRRADLCGADLMGANLSCEFYSEERIVGPTWQGSSILLQAGADLRGADLKAAYLRQASLFGANLRRAVYNTCARWPAGSEPTNHGAVRVR